MNRGILMKKIVLAALAATVIAAPAFAQTANNNSVNLAMEGDLPMRCSVQTSGATGTVNPLASGAQSLGTLTYTCNNESGFKIKFTSANGWNLKKSAAASFGINYSFSGTNAANQIQALNFSNHTTGEKELNVPFGWQNATNGGTTNQELFMTLGGQAGAGYSAGKYNDVITVAVQAN
jgi:hypothetical protein